MVVGNVSEFNPNEGNWNVFKKKLKQFYIANNFKDEDRKRAILLHSVCDETYSLLIDLCSPEEPENVKFEDIIAILDKHYITPRAGFVERCAFYDAKMKQDENLAEWAARVKHLSLNCKFEKMLDMVVRDKFVMGLPAGQIKEKLFAEDVSTLSFSKALEIAQAVKASQDVHVANMEKNLTPNINKMKINVQQQQQQIRCSVCGYFNHVAEQCKFRFYKCNYCGKPGHLQRMCNVKF